MPEEVAEELYRVLQQYNRERKDERVVGGDGRDAGGEAPDAARPRAAAAAAAASAGAVRSETEG